MKATVNPVLSDDILDSLNEGLYVCDKDRTITYWSKAAERITGWRSKEVVGRRCLDNVLAHVDKDGRRLCGEEFCPLHRSMCTDKGSSAPLIVFGLTSKGTRLPMSVSVSPIHDAAGQVVGGVETFHDFSETYSNLLRAKKIQTLSMDYELPQDDRVEFSTFYLPHDMVGGDYYAIHQLDSDHYGFVMADVMGHGVAAALYTMHLSSLWDRYSQTLVNPEEFAGHLNRELCKIVKDESFSTALCGVVDVARKSMRITSAGAPPLILFKADGRTEVIELPGWPFGVSADADYDVVEFSCAAQDRILMFSDGAIEIQNAKGRLLEAEGLISVLKSQGYPQAPIDIKNLHEALLLYSNEIRLNDDLSFVEIRMI